MTRGPIVPCLWFDAQAEDAARLYTSVFPSGHVTAVARYPEPSDNPSGKPRGSVLTVEFEVARQRFTALNGGPEFGPNPSISFFVQVDSIEEADRLFSALTEGGEVLMPLGAYPWSPRYGWTADRYGISWQVMAGRREPGDPTIVPCMMFSGAQQGRAEEAMRAYVALLPEGHIVSV